MSQPPGVVDRPRIERAVREILEALGEDPERDGLKRTPERVAAMYDELLGGVKDNPGEVLNVTFSSSHDELVLERDIPLFGMCEHHMVPFVGRAHVGYIPSTDGRITGLSKLARLVDGHARRLQIQEALTSQIADSVERVLQPRGVIVVLHAEHLCMSMRGARKPGATTVTSAVRGLFREDARTRAEALAYIHGNR